VLSCIFYITKTIPIHACNSYHHELILILYTWCFSLLKHLKMTALPQTMKLHLMHNLPILFLYLVFLDEQNCTITTILMSSSLCVGMYKTMFICDFKLHHCLNVVCFLLASESPRHAPYLLHICARDLHVGHYPPQPVSVIGPAPTLSPSSLLGQAMSEPNLFLYKYPNNLIPIILRA